jgi:hypothetical protein
VPTKGSANSNTILIPVAFGLETDIFTPPGGPPETFYTDPSAKGSSSPHGAQLVDCSYGFGPLMFPDGSTLEVSGTVTGFVTPASH